MYGAVAQSRWNDHVLDFFRLAVVNRNNTDYLCLFYSRRPSVWKTALKSRVARRACFKEGTLAFACLGSAKLSWRQPC